MQQGRVYRNKIFVGIIKKDDNEKYSFLYDNEYLKKEDARSISLTFPLQEEVFESDYLFSFFFNMLAEGELKDIQCKALRIDRDDDFSRLLKTTSFNTIGAVTIEEIKNGQ
jgi:serine/threonine-protein kinase HipA